MFVSVFDKGDFSAELLGGKGYGLWWMQQQGANVPPALIIPTTVCVEYMADPKATMETVAQNLHKVWEFFQSHLGYTPLMSVRSGARVSMPGMMDTILNVGINAHTRDFWVNRLGQKCAADCEHRFREMFGKIVHGQPFTNELPTLTNQLLESIEAVFKSWGNERAKIYRQMHNYPETWGTAVVIQAMVFGNLNDNSGTGVLFTRNPDTGEDVITGEYLQNAQGEDVVAGTVTPTPLQDWAAGHQALAEELMTVVNALETARKDVQDVEFTIEDGKLWILQTRNAKRSARAAVKIAVDMHAQGMITAADVCKRVTARDYFLAQQATVDPTFKTPAAFTGIPACSGVVTGVVMKSSAAAINCKAPCILVTEETTPDDIGGMFKAVGVLTMKGGSTSHAAVVARGMNRTCVTGLGAPLSAFPEGQKISICGATGRVWLSEVPLVQGSASAEIKALEKLLVKHAKVTPVDTEFAAKTMLLNLTGDLLMEPDRMVKKVRAVLAKADKVKLDLRLPKDDSWRVYYSLFYGPTMLQLLVNALEQDLSADERAKIVLIAPLVQTTFKRMVQVTTLADLVMAEGEFIMEGQMDAPMKKVLGWKMAEKKSVPVQIDGYTPGVPAHLSRGQMVSLLLA